MPVVQFTEPVVKHTTVTVQNVMIGKRQLTQRVFKQIQESDVINKKTGELEGDVWGYVNYFWDKHHTGKCRHILWVTPKGKLRRCYIEPWWLDIDEDFIRKPILNYLLNDIPQLYISV